LRDIARVMNVAYYNFTRWLHHLIRWGERVTSVQGYLDSQFRISLPPWKGVVGT